MSRSLYAVLSRRYGKRSFSRREVMKGALAASAGILISGCRSGDGRRGGGRARVEKRVAVVGAGFAGLACAHELSSAGYDVTVFEARQRVGGRVVSYGDIIAGKVVEGGGEFIGRNHPTWLAYAERLGLSFLDVLGEEAPSPVILDGRRLGEAEAQRLWAEMEAAYATMLDDAKGVDADEPWKSRGAAALDRRSVAEWLAAADVTATCRRAIAAELQANNGVSLDRQSYLGNLAQIKGGGLEQYWEESESLRCRGGNQQLAARLAQAIGHERILLRTPIVRVRQEGEALSLTAGDGRVHFADDVVLAVPPSVWHRMRIDPPLPVELRPQMGVAVKYVAALREPVWRRAGLSPEAFTDGDASMTWHATEGQGEGAVALSVFSGGPAADAVRGYPADRRDSEYLQRLAALYPDLGDFVSGTRFMDWPGDPWAMAGYSFPAPGEVTTQGPLLRRGVGNVHFAGEYACYAFIGYMEGALSSGAALAKRLAMRDGVIAKRSHLPSRLMGA